MSILIKGMDKPTDCGLCPFEDFGYCNVKGERNTSESGIDTDCPLIEVADRKTEPLICDGNCWMKKQNGEWLCEHCQRKPQTEPTISKMEQVDKDINVRSKDKPQTEREGE